MAKSKKNDPRNNKPTRYQRTMQIVVVVVSIILVLSMALSLATTI